MLLLSYRMPAPTRKNTKYKKHAKRPLSCSNLYNRDLIIIIIITDKLLINTIRSVGEIYNIFVSLSIVIAAVLWGNMGLHICVSNLHRGFCVRPFFNKKNQPASFTQTFFRFNKFSKFKLLFKNSFIFSPSVSFFFNRARPTAVGFFFFQDPPKNRQLPSPPIRSDMFVPPVHTISFIPLRGATTTTTTPTTLFHNNKLPYTNRTSPVTQCFRTYEERVFIDPSARTILTFFFAWHVLTSRHPQAPLRP